jgi:hypothetical protein
MVVVIPGDVFTPRLDLLEDSGQVSQVARQQALDFVDAVESTFDVALDEENGAMLITHLAMALTRSERREPLDEEPPAVIVDEARANVTELAFVREKLDAYGAVLGEPLPESEYVFMTAHLCTVTLPG